MEIFDIVNDKKIIENFENINYNWNMNPIKSINLVDYSLELTNLLEWKNNYFYIEKMNNFDYINIYMNNEGKICGKDNYGNNLYFPNGIECPINKIYFSEYDVDMPGYTKIELNNGNFLYYTNQSVDGKIVVDLRISSDNGIPLNPEYSSDFSFIPFFEEIDIDYSLDNSHLYSINYLGINTSSISEKEILRIKNFKKKIKLYKFLSKVKIAFLCCELIFLPFPLYFKLFQNLKIIRFKKHGKFCKCFCSVFLSSWVFSGLILGPLILLTYIIILIISLNIHIKYITNFMNRINSDFQRIKNDLKWNIIILIYHLIFLILFLFIYLILGEIINIYEEIIKNETIVKINIHNNDCNSKDSSISYKYNNNEETYPKGEKTEEKNLKKLYQEIINLKRDFAQEKEDLKYKIETQKNLIDKERDEIEKLNKIINNKNKDINDEKNINQKLMEKTRISLELMDKKEKEINSLRSNLPFQINEGEKLMCVIFVTGNQEIHYPFICKDKQKFNELENILYEKFPNYKKNENFFTVNGNKINKSKTLEENKIKDGDVIQLNAFE